MAEFKMGKVSGRADEKMLWTSIGKCLQPDAVKFMEARNIKTIQREKSRGGRNDD